VTFVEQHAATCRVLRQNLSHCGFENKAIVMGVSAQRALRAAAEDGVSFDGAFIDPPYGRNLAAESLGQLAALSLLQDHAWVMVEHHADDVLAPAYGSLHLTHSRRYGKTCLTLFQANATNAPGSS
jgi:16S rRNA (guanine966-N2)-methyltransferase